MQLIPTSLVPKSTSTPDSDVENSRSQPFDMECVIVRFTIMFPRRISIRRKLAWANKSNNGISTSVIRIHRISTYQHTHCHRHSTKRASTQIWDWCFRRRKLYWFRTLLLVMCVCGSFLWRIFRYPRKNGRNEVLPAGYSVWLCYVWLCSMLWQEVRFTDVASRSLEAYRRYY